MFGQTFSLLDLPQIFTLSFLELLLSADNAVVIGLMIHAIAKEQRKKALWIGVISAFFFRAFGLLGASFLLRYSSLQLLGGIYLLYVCIHHFFFPKKVAQPPASPSAKSFWKAVLAIELVDFAFAIDSILAGVAFIGPTDLSIHPKLWIVYFGGMIGLIGVRYAAQFFGYLIQRYPRLEWSAYILVGWVGGKLALTAFHGTLPGGPFLFWGLIVLLFLYGLSKTQKEP